MKSQLSCLDFPLCSFSIVIYIISPIVSLILRSHGDFCCFSFFEPIRALSHLRPQVTNYKNSKTFLEKFPVFRLFGQTRDPIDTLRSDEISHRRLQNTYMAESFKTQNFNSFLLLLTISLTVFVSVKDVFSGTLDVSAIIALNILIGRAFSSMSSLPEIIKYISRGSKMPELRRWQTKPHAPVKSISQKF